jgi:arylsulfatase A-like enzyme
MVVNIDFAPTILNIAGVPIPSDMQGQSVLPLTTGKKVPNWRKSMYYHYYEYPDAHRVMPHFGIRNERYKLIYFYGKETSWELIDLKKDPDETINAYNNPKHRALIVKMKKELRALMKMYKDEEALGILDRA